MARLAIHPLGRVARLGDVYRFPRSDAALAVSDSRLFEAAASGGAVDVRYLIVAGGAGGGAGLFGRTGGGGGAGGVRDSEVDGVLPISATGSYPVVVGEGGPGGITGFGNPNRGSNGGNSSFGGLTAIGGGPGGAGATGN